MRIKSNRRVDQERADAILPATDQPSRDLALVSVVDLPESDAGMPRRRRLPRFGMMLHRLFNRIFAESSEVSTAPVLDVRDFGWTATLRARWQAIRDEAAAVALQSRPVPTASRRRFQLWNRGAPVDANCARCPVTSALVGEIPGLDSAFFSILAPGTHVPPHHGATKGLITCHLGLIVPRDGDVRMRVDRRILRWAEGETLVFDDTYPHELWNDSARSRVVLLLQFRRPLRNPGRWLADRLFPRSQHG